MGGEVRGEWKGGEGGGGGGGGWGGQWEGGGGAGALVGNRENAVVVGKDAGGGIGEDEAVEAEDFVVGPLGLGGEIGGEFACFVAQGDGTFDGGGTGGGGGRGGGGDGGSA